MDQSTVLTQEPGVYRGSRKVDGKPRSVRVSGGIVTVQSANQLRRCKAGSGAYLGSSQFQLTPILPSENLHPVAPGKADPAKLVVLRQDVGSVAIGAHPSRYNFLRFVLTLSYVFRACPRDERQQAFLRRGNLE